MSTPTAQNKNIVLENDNKTRSIIKKSGYFNSAKICDTISGSIWKSFDKSVKKNVAIKVMNKYKLTNNGYISQEHNIMKEINILKYLTECTDSLHCVATYYAHFKTNLDYFLVMEHCGRELFDFAIRGHKFVSLNKIDIFQWHKYVKVIFKQIIKFTEYLHSLNIAHFDISLENILINDIEIMLYKNKNNGEEKIKICIDNLSIKLCDFGLSEVFYGDNKNDEIFLCNKYCGKLNYVSPEIIENKKLFNAKYNDIWSIGVCLFMLIIGKNPWDIARKNNLSFWSIINGDINTVLKKWDKLNYSTSCLNKLFLSIFQYEEKRTTLNEIKNSLWLNKSS